MESQFNTLLRTQKMLRTVMPLKVTVTARISILQCVFRNTWLHHVNTPKLLSPPLCTTVHMMSASWIGVSQCSQLVPHWKLSDIDSAILLFKVLVAVWTQRVLKGRNPGGCHSTCTRLNWPRWRSSAKLHLLGIKQGNWCERTGQSRWQP